jgi:hypothetical protein
MNFLRRLLDQISASNQEVALAPKPPTKTTTDPIPSPSHHLRYAQSSDVGKSRTNNQDSCTAFAISHDGTPGQPDFGLFIVTWTVKKPPA